MARRPRNFVPGFPYHLTQRGNRKQNTFLDDTDRRVYFRLLAQYCAAQGVAIWAYCLMGNHVHHIAVPEKERSLSLAFQRIHGEYARYFNARHVKTGHLWQGRFKACVLDEGHLWNAVRYVERNPVRAGIAVSAEAYRWSSAAAHCGLRKDSILSPGLPFVNAISDWSGWLAPEEKLEDVEFIRERTQSGRPCASDDFARMLEARLGRPMLKRKTGPKKKTSTEAAPIAPEVQKSLGFE